MRPNKKAINRNPQKWNSFHKPNLSVNTKKTMLGISVKHEKNKLENEIKLLQEKSKNQEKEKKEMQQEIVNLR